MTFAIALLAAATFGQQVRTVYPGLPSNDVQSVVTGPDGYVYARTAAGAARFENDRWLPVPDAPMLKRRPVELPTKAGIPYDDITAVERAEDGSYWVGTSKGAIRYAGGKWEYRQGPRWLPDDYVRSVAVQGNRAFFATVKGVSVIETKPTSYANKARFFEAEIDKRHRRTEYGYVLGVNAKTPGDASEYTQTDSDNDGLWTAMYGAGECFACAAKVPGACERAKAAFEALRFLGEVTRGTAPPGYVARTVLPASGPDPNLVYTPEKDEERRKTRDGLWKVMRPRWPKSADGKWYWKADTSSDELDGHYFFYALYYDLVAKDPRVQEHVTALTDHLINNNFQFIDPDGKPTRWGVFNPENLNANLSWWEERGLNSISILSYLKTAEHITGHKRFADAARMLIDKHHYDMNVLIPKPGGGIGKGNQSDDEMAFMCLYNLLRYETDQRLRMMYGRALRDRWEIEAPELNPLFNFIAAAALRGVFFEEPPNRESLEPKGEWLEESLDTLRRFPLDRFNWPLQNSHRKDLVRGRVLPIDERFVGHWNHDPWQLDSRGDGRHLADGAAYLLPYYMGLYYRFVPAD